LRDGGLGGRLGVDRLAQRRRIARQLVVGRQLQRERLRGGLLEQRQLGLGRVEGDQAGIQLDLLGGLN
jgi:hypothetical protein